MFTFLDLTTINIYSQVGLITLVGLIAKNGILIVEFANTLQERGLEKLAALREASLTRLRPVLMTSAATVFGHFPLVLVVGPGRRSAQQHRHRARHRHDRRHAVHAVRRAGVLHADCSGPPSDRARRAVRAGRGRATRSAAGCRHSLNDNPHAPNRCGRRGKYVESGTALSNAGPEDERARRTGSYSPLTLTAFGPEADRRRCATYRAERGRAKMVRAPFDTRQGVPLRG